MGTLARLLLALCLALYASQPAQAAEVPPHLIGLAQTLLGEVTAQDYAAAGVPFMAKDVEQAWAQSRLRQWRGIAPRVAVDVNALASPFGLKTEQTQQRALLDALLAAPDRQRRDAALAHIFDAQKIHTHKSRLAARQAFERTYANHLQSLARVARIPLPDDRALVIEWEPESASVLARFDLGERHGELVVHGAATGRIEDGNLIFEARADAEPVTWISPSMQARVNQQIHGVWLDQEGHRWLIRNAGAPNPDPSPAQADTRREMADLKQALTRLEAEKIYVWVDDRGGEVVQTRFRRLPAPFRYDRERSQTYNRGQIDALKQRIATLSATLPPELPVSAHDPLKLGGDTWHGHQALQITVRQKNGWTFSYDQAAYDGRRAVANRTLRDQRDIIELPDWVIRTLIASWSPPEWVELQARLNPRDGSLRLDGLRWRLVVHYSAGLMQEVHAIDSPWSTQLSLTREHPLVLLRIVDLHGNTLDSIAHDQPFRVEASYIEAPQAPPLLTAQRNRGELAIELAPRASPPDPRQFASAILYVRAADWAGRPEPGALLLPQRYVDPDELEEHTQQWRKQVAESRRVAADLFRNQWHIEHKNAAGDAATSGVATMAPDGGSAQMTLHGPPERHYRSIDMRAWRSANAFGHLLELQFEHVDTADDNAMPGHHTYGPLPKGQVLYYPLASQEIGFTLEGAQAYADLSLQPPPGQTLLVHLHSNDADHLSGLWQSTDRAGERLAGGEQYWTRGAAKLRIGQLDFDYSPWHAARMGLATAVDHARQQVLAVNEQHQDQLRRVAERQALVQRSEQALADSRTELFAAIEAQDEIPDALKDVAYRRYENRLTRGRGRLEQIMERLPLAAAPARARLVREAREIETLMGQDQEQLLAREDALGITRHRTQAAQRAQAAAAHHLQISKDLARAVSERNILANVLAGTLDDYHAAVEQHTGAQQEATLLGHQAPLITRVSAPHYAATIWHPEDDLRLLERRIAETRNALHYWDERRRHYRHQLPDRAEAVDAAAASLIRWQRGSLAAQAGLELVVTGTDILVKLRTGGPHAALGEAYKKIVENLIWPPTYLDANNLTPEGHNLLDTLAAHAPDTTSTLQKRFFKAAGTGAGTGAGTDVMVAAYLRSNSASRLQELTDLMLRQTWLDGHEDALAAVRREFELSPLFTAQRNNLARAEKQLAQATSLRSVGKNAVAGFLAGTMQDYAEHEAQQALANLLEGEAFQAYSAAQLEFSATSTLLLRSSNYYWQAVDLLSGLTAAKREILKQYDPANAMKISGNGETDGSTDLLIEFSDRGRDPHHPNPIAMDVYFGPLKAERLSGDRLIFRVPAEQLQTLSEGEYPLKVVVRE